MGRARSIRLSRGTPGCLTDRERYGTGCIDEISVNRTQICHSEVSNGKTVLPFQKFRLFLKISSGTNRKVLFYLHPNWNFGKWKTTIVLFPLSSATRAENVRTPVSLNNAPVSLFKVSSQLWKWCAVFILHSVCTLPPVQSLPFPLTFLPSESSCCSS